MTQYRADLDRRLDRLLAGPEPGTAPARRLFGIDPFPWTVCGLADYGLAAASCMSAS